MDCLQGLLIDDDDSDNGNDNGGNDGGDSDNNGDNVMILMRTMVMTEKVMWLAIALNFSVSCSAFD